MWTGEPTNNHQYHIYPLSRLAWKSNELVLIQIPFLQRINTIFWLSQVVQKEPKPCRNILLCKNSSGVIYNKGNWLGWSALVCRWTSSFKIIWTILYYNTGSLVALTAQLPSQPLTSHPSVRSLLENGKRLKTIPCHRRFNWSQSLKLDRIPIFWRVSCGIWPSSNQVRFIDRNFC